MVVVPVGATARGERARGTTVPVRGEPVRTDALRATGRLNLGDVLEVACFRAVEDLAAVATLVLAALVLTLVLTLVLVLAALVLTLAALVLAALFWPWPSPALIWSAATPSHPASWSAPCGAWPPARLMLMLIRSIVAVRLDFSGPRMALLT